MNQMRIYNEIFLSYYQQEVFDCTKKWLINRSGLFILKGFAGTGKTTLIKTLVSYLNQNKIKFSLMAPTGRAAAILQQKTNHPTFTIHKSIYSFDKLEELKLTDEEGQESFFYYYGIRNSDNVTDQVFIIDEASMVSDVENHGEFFRFGSGCVLRDLISYTRVNHPGMGTKIIFVGDPAQLPPVGMNFSPALDEKYLTNTYQLDVQTAELTEIMRQDKDNLIVQYGQNLRDGIRNGYYNYFHLNPDNRTIFQPSYSEFLNEYYKKDGDRIIITHKNKTASELNHQIRTATIPGNLHIMPGDLIIVGVNNYKHEVLNGEFGIVIKISDDTFSRSYNLKKGTIESRIILTWRYIELLFKYTTGIEKIVKGYMLENYLESNFLLTPDEQRALYIDFKVRHEDLESGTPEFRESLKNDLFFNALMIKYGYAVTCHKAQGGEWGNVFVVWDYSTPDEFDFTDTLQSRSGKTNESFFRWAYTAITRSSNRLYNLNPPAFSPFSSLGYVPSQIFEELNNKLNEKKSKISIIVDEFIKENLNRFGIITTERFLKHKFIEVDYLAGHAGYSIIGVTEKPYQESYTFLKGGKIVSLVFFYNKRQQFTGFQTKGSVIGSEEMVAELSSLLCQDIDFEIIEEPDDTISKEVREFIFDEAKPYLRYLYDALNKRLDKFSITIEQIEHIDFRERYMFSRGVEKAVFDFVYDQRGFFSSASELEKQCNSANLLNDLKRVIDSLNPVENDLQGNQ